MKVKNRIIQRVKIGMTVLCLFAIWAATDMLSSKSRWHESGKEALVFEHIIDGDTFRASGRKIRMWGINAPERNRPGYFAAKLLLESTLKQSGELTCYPKDIDRYGRHVMQCFSDGLDLGSMMVQTGMARDYKRFSGGYYAGEQAIARTSRRGIWEE